ncbi:MAG: toxin co-regulated pilus biosynthesis Q family protein [Lactobacillaceae bacterium]|jgi:hypothetical protein|nr:toxin co-regulated pilus biosynthesis Q family protein [Lactobacillaceae bacterium]
MMKECFEKIKTNKKILIVACFACLFMIAGCAGSIMQPAYSVPEDSACDDFGAPRNANGECVDNGEFVSYTQTSAQYREYGERTPRDQYVTQAGAGNNISAAIPPSIEEEVMDYEDQISMTDSSKDGMDNDYDSGTADDPVEDWLAEEGQTLRNVLTEWSEKAGWRLVWNTNRNYNITAGAMFRGRFADVSSALIRAFARARPAPIATFYKGNRVLVVETMEDENAYN